MDQINLLRQYQSIDARIDDLESALKSSDVRRKLLRARQYLLSSQDALRRMDAQAKEMRILYETIFAKHKQLSERIGQMEDDIRRAGMDTPIAEVENLRREVQDSAAAMAKFEKDLQRMMVSLRAMSERFRQIVVNVPKAKKEYSELKKVYDVRVSEMKAQSVPFRNQLRELEGKIDRTLLKRYRNVKQNHTVPFVPIEGNRCTGCNMELPSGVLFRIREGKKMFECENCGRILYVPGDDS
jgi:predicted  nucleic acid-binding Zn-ribbon protein